ncbi:MAG TPA: helicase-related protein [Candidatus Saccharimonadales bacterium]|nr:helicase-related protein [Candidatus Saccharimonadales bacterium]
MAVDRRWLGIGGGIGLLNMEGIEFREYQLNIVRSILERGNTLVVIPTGLGKTFIGAAVMADALARDGRALLLAPTKPLAEQHYSTLAGMLNTRPEEILLLLGSTAKEKRRASESDAKVIIATPQTVANDLKGGYLSLENFKAVVFDECHRAVGKYAYTYIANECNLKNILIVGLTASPGGKKEKIKPLVESLGIRHIEARISTDPDVARYVMPKNIHVINVETGERLNQIAGLVAPEAEASLAALNKTGLLHFKNFSRIPKGRLLQAGDEIGKIQATNYRYAAIYSYVRLLNLSHAYDLLMTEGIYPFHKYMDGLAMREKKSRAVESLLSNKNIIQARKLADEAMKNGEEHPKVIAVIDVIKGYREKSAIIFVQYRSTIKMLVEYLNNNGFGAKAFVGKKEGVTQEMQKAIIEDFRAKKFNVLVASSIAEEGLDIPSVDVVVFYEPIPSEIRNIQRRGRTGRFREGEIYILVATGTKDEVYMRISSQREKKMLSVIRDINRELERLPPKEDSRQSQLKPE